MHQFKADLHTHTVLSPCGSLEMSPQNIVDKAFNEGINLLGITDHNSTLMCRIMQEVATEKGITILTGAEVTTKEEVHCLAFFDNFTALDTFQTYLEQHIAQIKNNPEKFGYQVVVDKNEQIINEVDILLISALDQTIDQVERKVHELNGLFIPAHIDRAANGLISQLGFIPPDLKADALELSKFVTYNEYHKQQPQLSVYTTIQSSDAHFIDNIGDATSTFHMEECTFEEVRLALKNKNHRKVTLR